MAVSRRPGFMYEFVSETLWLTSFNERWVNIWNEQSWILDLDRCKLYMYTYEKGGCLFSLDVFFTALGTCCLHVVFPQLLYPDIHGAGNKLNFWTETQGHTYGCFSTPHPHKPCQALIIRSDCWLPAAPIKPWRTRMPSTRGAFIELTRLTTSDLYLCTCSWQFEHWIKVKK